MKTNPHFAMCIIAAVATVLSGSAQSRHERKVQQVADSGAPQNVPGGVSFKASVSFATAMDAVVNKLKREGHAIERADRDAGEVASVMEITGGYSQTGTRILISFIKDSDTETTIRVVVTKQKRKKLLQTEPWGAAKANEAESRREADVLEAGLKG